MRINLGFPHQVDFFILVNDSYQEMIKIFPLLIYLFPDFGVQRHHAPGPDPLPRRPEEVDPDAGEG